MSTNSEDMGPRRLWTNGDDLNAQLDGAVADAPAPPQSEDDFTLDGVSRRNFMGVIGASAAVAGVGLQGCLRKPKVEIVPHAKRPEDQVPGTPIYYATTFQQGRTVYGVLVESHDGRPTKVEGNPAHPNSLGATSATAQTSILDLYDLARSEAPRHKGGAQISWDAAFSELDASISGAKKVALVLPTVMSPTLRRVLMDAGDKFDIYRSDLTHDENAQTAAEWIGGAGAHAVADLADVKIIAAFDNDFLSSGEDAVRLTKAFSARRRAGTDPTKDDGNRLYVVEPNFTPTGAMADHRVRAKGADVGAILRAVARDVSASVTVPVSPGTSASTLDANQGKFAAALAKDLVKNKGAAVVFVGPRQPAWVHALAHGINAAVAGDSVTWRADADAIEMAPLSELVAKIADYDVIACIDTNPAFASAGGLGVAKALAAAKTLVHAGIHYDETGELAALHLPLSHALESWGDQRSLDGTASLVQPLIAPLFYTPSVLELVARVVRGGVVTGHDLVRETWTAQQGGRFTDKLWRRWLHDGVIETAPPATPRLGFDLASKEVAKAGAEAPVAGKVEVNLHLDAFILDGRHANNGWALEAPDPMTKLTWDNAASISRKTAGALGISTEDLVTVTVGQASVTLPAKIVPGQADDTVSIAVGYGRRAAELKLAQGAGFDVYGLMQGGWFASGSVSKAGGTYPLADTQKYGNSQTPPLGDFEPRLLAAELDTSTYRKMPNYVQKLQDKVMPADKVKSHIYPDIGGFFTGAQQWGMTVDLNACTGCNACVVACQAENNISVVGKDRVLMGREMHWMRIDRYYQGDDEDNPEAILQPMMCQQCETAPCESVCPVRATTHSPEGLNDMAYNRCIGTRYCANNCPYKVRRFNYFNFNGNIHPLAQMQKNPDVTIRFRGVMEKCSFCVQRINVAKIASKVGGTGGVVPDGGIQMACEQVCPADAITFGDIKDPNTRVSQLKASPRDYQVLREFNTRPRTSYLVKLRNRNPDLA